MEYRNLSSSHKKLDNLSLSNFPSNFSLEKLLPGYSIDDLEYPPTPPEYDYNDQKISITERRHHNSDFQLDYLNSQKLTHLKTVNYRTPEDFSNQLLKKFQNNKYISPLTNNNVQKNSVDELNVEFNNVKNENYEILKEGKDKNYIYLFITYSLDSEDHYRNVINLKKCLENYGKFKVYMDAYEQTSMAKDIYGWMNFCFKNADFILPIISPLYKMTTESIDSLQNVLINEHIKQTRYIFGLMQREIYENNFRNNRIRPLILSDHNGGVAKQHVPHILSNTLVYQWPRDDKDYVRLLIKTFEQTSLTR
ncbi:unnamed protein product [Gordionus sp. m RMFG-2023]|uniref:uncharacterized protein LOC135926291 n=1 Tax=Gordionus sp. m RMFG-2023 TaxID=3053472 RepID=UPI0030E3260B